MPSKLNWLKMEFFALIQTHLALCGIAITQNESKKQTFNLKNSTVFILSSLYTILTAASLNESNSFDESTNVIFRSFSLVACTAVYEMIVWKTSKLSKFINGLAATVDTSKCTDYVVRFLNNHHLII